MISPEELKILKSFAERIPVDDPGAHNNLAIVYYNKSLYDEAVEELEKALRVDPNFVLARNNLDIILKKTGRLEQRVERLSRIIDKEPYDENKTLELADTYRKLSRYSQAIIFYRKILDYNPGSFEGHFGLGITLKLLGKYDDALEEIKKALEIKIAPDVYRALGELYFNKGIVDLAIRNFQESILLDPASAEGHFMLGFALGEKGKTKESVEAVRRAIELNPALAQFEANLPIDIGAHRGHWEFLKGQLGMPKLSENEFQVHYNIGMTYRNKGLFAEAKRELEECLKMKPNDPGVIIVLCEIAVLAGRIDDSLKLIERIGELEFDSPTYNTILGAAYFLKGDRSSAEKNYQIALSHDPKYSPAMNNLAVLYQIQGRSEDALDFYLRAASLGNSDAQYNAGMLFLRAGDLDRAYECLKGPSADEIFGAGLVLMERGNDSQALENFRKVIALAPNYAGAYYNMGFVLTKLGKFKEGLDYIRKGMEIEPNYEKDKYHLCLEPELCGFGPFYSVGVRSEEKTEALPELEIPTPDSYLKSAESHLQKNELENALTMVDEALNLQPDWVRAVVIKAEILSRIRSPEAAVDVLEDYIVKHPDENEARAILAKVYDRAGESAKALNIYDHLLKHEPDNVGWLTDAANLKYALKDNEGALRLYQRLHDLNSDSLEANLGFARLYLMQRMMNEAEPYLKVLSEKYPDSYDYTVLAGIYHLEKNNRKEAARFFERSIERDSSRPLPYYHLGLLLVQSGDFEGACDNWKKALLLSPDKELAKKIRHCLKITYELTEFLRKEV